jgi:hypothetical protein
VTKEKTQSQKQDDVVGYAQKLIDYGRKGMQHEGVLRRREKAVQYRRGQHKIKLRPDRYGNQVWNKFGQIAHQRVAHILSKKPKWRFLPRQEGAIFAADALNDIVGNVMWDILDWSEKGEISVNEAWNAGTSHIKVYVKENGFPDAIPCSAHQIIIDPDAKRAKDRRFWVHVYPMNVTDINNDWGVKVHAEAIVDDIDKGSIERSYEQSGNNLAPAQVFKGEDGKWISEAVGKALIYEVWSGDATLESIPFKDQEITEEHEAFKNFQNVIVAPHEHHPRHIKAHELYITTLDPDLDNIQIVNIVEHISEHQSYPQKEKRKKYPFGRKTMICQGKYLEDGPNPFALEMDEPVGYNDLLIKWDYDIVDDSYWGKSGGHDLYDPQDAINHRKNAITQMINRMNHGIKTMLSRSYDALRGSFRKMGNLIGTIIPLKNHDDFKIDFGPQFPGQIFQDEYHSEEFMDQLSHQTDILSGQFPKGSPPGVTVNQLSEMGMVSINLVVAHYARGLQKVARIVSHLMIEFVSPEELFRIVDNKRNWQFIKWNELKEEMGRYDIHIDVDSMLSTSRQEKLDTAMRAYEIKLFDRQGAFDYLDLPNKYEVLQRVSEIENLEAENEQLKAVASKAINEVERLDQNLRAMQAKEGNKDAKDKNK